MGMLADEIIEFFQNQPFVIVSTLDKKGSLHNSCKGIVEINRPDIIYLLDLYRRKTYQNLKQNPQISITAVDEDSFVGYCLKGKAKIIRADKVKSHVISAWEKKITSRIAQRVIKNIREEKRHPRHPEALLPKPEYLIVMQVEEIVDLTPQRLKTEN
jgi:predicted pyridoxine 5'-phosphate oxidase superfamily flavin-nucleotide-binding protein